jgi:hypothetical protein
MAGSLHRHRQFTLMPEAIPGNTTWDNASPLGQEVPQKANIFEIDGPFFKAKPAWPTALEKSSAASRIASSTVTSGTFTFHNRLPFQLLRFFIFINRTVMRLGFATTSAPAAIASLGKKGDRLRDDFMFTTLLAIFRFPTPLLQTAINDNTVSLAEILPTMFRLFSKHHDINETDFFFELITLLVAAADSQSQRSNWGSVRRVPQLGVTGEIPYQDNFVKPGHQKTPLTSLQENGAAPIPFQGKP